VDPHAPLGLPPLLADPQLLDADDDRVDVLPADLGDGLGDRERAQLEQPVEGGEAELEAVELGRDRLAGLLGPLQVQQRAHRGHRGLHDLVEPDARFDRPRSGGRRRPTAQVGQ
jgi:hypothetical protein